MKYSLPPTRIAALLHEQLERGDLTLERPDGSKPNAEQWDILERALHAYSFEYWQRIDVKNPDHSGWYHVWAPHGENRQYECIEKAYFESSTGVWRWTMGYPITHWNFMPSPPRGDEGEPF